MNPGTAGLARGLEVLGALAEPEAAREGLGVVRLAAIIGADKSQLSRALATLAEAGFVERDHETLAYRIGWRVFALAARTAESRLLVAGPAVLRGLVAELGESAHLSVRQGVHVLTLLSESSASTLHAPGRVGALTPLTTTSAGRALVSDLGEQELDALGLASASEAIARARRDGYAIVREEFEAGLVAAAAPIRDPAGHIIAALNISAPGFRFEHRLEEAARCLVEAADALSRVLRGDPLDTGRECPLAPAH
ncbi:MAG TPA: IclR family transcriptional regulator [Gaiellales bacterium]|jgi:DNA-binding IclR family transcriptional regulator|nr:IclR family transcriptional regulator [Gaiellales bacterium]